MPIEDRGGVSVVTHALAQHTLTDLRDVETEQVAFRKGLVKLGRICGYDLIDGRLDTESVSVRTPLTETTGTRVRGLDDIVIVNVLRAATPFVEGLSKAFPTASVPSDMAAILRHIAQRFAPTRTYLVWHLISVGLGVGACVVPLFNVLGYESAALFGVVLGVATVFLTLHAFRGDEAIASPIAESRASAPLEGSSVLESVSASGSSAPRSYVCRASRTSSTDPYRSSTSLASIRLTTFDNSGSYSLGGTSSGSAEMCFAMILILSSSVIAFWPTSISYAISPRL